MICNNCGIAFESLLYCPGCGLAAETTVQTPTKKGKAIAAIGAICSSLSGLAIFFFPPARMGYSLIASLFLVITGVVLSIVANKRKERQGFVIAGFVASIISLIFICVVIFVVFREMDYMISRGAEFF